MFTVLEKVLAIEDRTEQEQVRRFWRLLRSEERKVREELRKKDQAKKEDRRKRAPGRTGRTAWEVDDEE